MEIVNVSWMLAFMAIVFLFLTSTAFKAYIAAFAVLVNVVLTSWLAFPALFGDLVEHSVYAGSLLGDVAIRIDALSAWFIIIINFTTLTGLFYGIGYLKAYHNPTSKLTLHWGSFILFHLSMVTVCMLQNSFAFLMAWEVMSLSSMLLVIFDHERAATIKAGINYLVQMHIGVALLTAAFIWVYSATGSFNFEAIHSFFKTNNNTWLFLLYFVGFGIKAGFIPLHTWLPHAHPAAPSHVSGIMSGVIVKMGIYGIIRMASFLCSDFVLLGEIILTVSVLTGVYGILNASVNRDFKCMLAYCTVENIGIIGIGIGIGLIGMGNASPLMFCLGFGGALLHTLNHSLFKSLLFFSSGSVFQQTHTRNMEHLGGLIKTMPKTATLFLLGATAICGLPPFNGFVSEFIIYSGLIQGIHASSISQILLMVLSLAGLSIIGGLSLLTFTKSFGVIFLGQPRTVFHHKTHEVSSWMLVPQYLIIAVMLSIAFVPQFYFSVLGNALGSIHFYGDGMAVLENYAKNISQISTSSLLLIIVILCVWVIRAMVMKNHPQSVESTWGCGYVAPNSRQQYTGKSFSKPLGKIMDFLIIEKKSFKKLAPGEIFPEKRSYHSHYLDFFEYKIIGPVARRLTYSANYFSFIQNGRIQSYVLYGIVFILAMFVLTLFNIVS